MRRLRRFCIESYSKSMSYCRNKTQTKTKLQLSTIVPALFLATCLVSLQPYPKLFGTRL